MSLINKEKLKIINKFGYNKKNTGSTEVQIAILTFNINKLQIHFIKNKKDYSSRKGLLKMVSKRKKLLSYIKNKNLLKYSNLIKCLNLRR
ncbi:MAG: 30S ribosomal protein S15 [Candidatus Makana argininalis]